MSGFDRGRIFTAQMSGGTVASEDGGASEGMHQQKQQSQKSFLERQFQSFIRDFQLDNEFIYREQLVQNYNTHQYFLEVDLAHLTAFDELLVQQINRNPSEILPHFEDAVRSYAAHLHAEEQLLAPESEEADGSQLRMDTVPEFQILLSSPANAVPIRDLTSDHISRLIRVPGIIISASTVSAKATRLHIVCRSCGHNMKLRLRAGISGAALPRSCQRAQVDMHQSTTTEATRCPIDPYLIMPDRCSFIDQQTVKLQEAPEQVPVGELPRNMLATLDRYLANSTRSVPGTRVTIVGVYSIFQGRASRGSSGGGAAVRSAYIRAIGIEVDGDSSGRAPKRSFTEAEEAAMLRLARQPDIYEKFARSVAPSIYGYDDIKRAATCLLFGGSRKQLADGMRLRGDVNVLLLGDPGTAKSQLLKFIERVAPIGVYTSGKGSSAAGLTASVVRDAASREFYLEGGAMVLADGGVVCIDEFDKMREEDRVAIHEAMEQQTISIAKAGITTVLNSRTSVMAAANPVFGRYDDMKSPGENVDFQSTILSRFDLIFIVKDEHSHDKDMSLARHVIRVHSGGSSASLSASEQAAGELDMSTMKTFISYVRSRCAPRLSPEAADKLANHFVSIRSAVRAHEADSHTRSTIPITIRQLEAIIRISESLAKIRLAPFAGPEHVEEALRLFQVSTLSAVQSGQMIDGVMRDNVLEEVERVEREIRRRVPVGSRIPSQLLSNDLIGRRNFSKTAVEKALQVMLRRQELRHINQRRVVERMF